MHPWKLEFGQTISRYETQCKQKSQTIPEKQYLQPTDQTMPSFSLTTTSATTSEKDKPHPEENFPDHGTDSTPSK